MQAISSLVVTIQLPKQHFNSISSFLFKTTCINSISAKYSCVRFFIKHEFLNFSTFHQPAIRGFSLKVLNLQSANSENQSANSRE